MYVPQGILALQQLMLAGVAEMAVNCCAVSLLLVSSKLVNCCSIYFASCVNFAGCPEFQAVVDGMYLF